MRAGSLCTGAAMLDAAVNEVFGPVERVFVSEVDPGASALLAASYPSVPNLGDLTAVDWSTVGPVDLLCGGIPCQPWSLAGSRNGSLDERDLWPVRKRDGHGNPRRGAVDAIAALRPRIVLLENVAGLLTAEDGRPFGQILADLDRLGYSVAWTVFGACKVGACHHRHRMYLYATRDAVDMPDREPAAWRPDGVEEWVEQRPTLFGDFPPFGAWPQGGLCTGGFAWDMPVDPCGSSGLLLPTPTARVANRRGSPSPETAARRIHEEGRRNLGDAIALLPTPRVSAERTGRSAILNSSSSPSLAQAVELMRGELPRELHSWDEAPASWLPLPTPTARDASRGRGWADSQTGRPLSEVVSLLPTPRATRGGSSTETVALLPTPRACDEVGGPGRRNSHGSPMLPAAVQPGRFGAYEAAVRRQEVLFGLVAPEPTEPGRLGNPRLTAAFPEWMLGCPPGWITDHVDRRAAIRIAGNGVVRQAAAVAYALLAERLTLATERAA